MLSTIVHVLFPARCFGCGVHLVRAELLAGCCDSCAHTVHLIESPRCPQCATPREVRTGIDERCGQCLAQRPHYDKVHARWVYDGAVSDAIRRAKASSDPASLFALLDSGREDIGALLDALSDRFWTTPPVHDRDLVRRGWDPARAALRRIAPGKLDVRDPLRKTFRTTKQAFLDRDARRAALRGAFDAVGPVTGDWVVFDDVMTTGATLDEAARALRRAGAASVTGFVIARSV